VKDSYTMSSCIAFRHPDRAPTTPDRAPTTVGTDTAGLGAPDKPFKPFKHLHELDLSETPPGFRIASSGNIIPSAMNTSSHSARKVYVRDGQELDIPEYTSSIPALHVSVKGNELHEAQREKVEFENAVDDNSTEHSDDVPGTEPEEEETDEHDERLPGRRWTGLYICLGCGNVWDGNAQCPNDEEKCGTTKPYYEPEDVEDGGNGGGNDYDEDDDDDDDAPPSKRAKLDINPEIEDIVDKAIVQSDNLPLAPLPVERRVLVPETPPSTPKPTPSGGVVVPETPLA